MTRITVRKIDVRGTSNWPMKFPFMPVELFTYSTGRLIRPVEATESNRSNDIVPKLVVDFFNALVFLFVRHVTSS